MEEFKDIDVLALLPQRPPFVLIDSLCHFDMVRTVTSFEVRPDHIFVEGDELQEYGIVENIAQTCAARMGYINFINSDKVKLGFIGAIRNCCILRRPKVGEVLTTTINVLEEVFQMTLVEATVNIGEEVIASSLMKIAISEIEAKE